MNNIRNYALHGARPSHLLPMIVTLLLMWLAPGLAYADDTTEPTLNESGYYEISTAAQLKWFADKVNSGDNSINGVLTADIDVSTLDAAYWTPIGLWDENGKTNIFYKGKFDGQNHTVTGIVLRKAIASGLFGVTQGATIRNVIVKGAKMKATRDDVMSSIQYGVAPVCGLATSGTVIENCHSRLTDILYAINQYNNCTEINCVGGIVGELRESTAKDCTADGFVRTDGTSVGGIVGLLNSGLVSNCHFRNYDGGSSAVVGKDYVGGIAGYLRGRTRANAIVGCTVADSIILSATVGSCDTICGTDSLFEEPGLFNGYYEIYTPKQLQWFATKVNGGSTSINGKLMNDINMGNQGYLHPIGSSDHPFAGVFDGQEFTIDSVAIWSQKYAGMFGYVKDGAIKNINLNHPWVNALDNDYQGLIAGFLTQNGDDKTKNGYIENCHVTNGEIARDQSTGTPDNVGGIVGKVDMSAEVRDCSFQGIIKAHEQRIGGIAGYMDSGAKLYRCTTIGPSTVWGNNYVGGVVGYMTDTQTLIDNCDVDQSTGVITIHAESGNNSGLVRGYDKAGGVTKSKYNEGYLQYEVTGKKVSVNGKSVTETHITGVSTSGKVTYYACVDIGSSGSDYFNTVIESVDGAEELYFWDNVSNLAGTKACGWINMTINDYAFGSNFKSLKMMYRMFAGDDHDVMLRPGDVRPAGDKMFAHCPDAKVYVDAEYYDEFCNDSIWGKYKSHLVPTTSMRKEDVNAEYGARYAYDRNRDNTGSVVKVSNGTVYGSHQVHVIGADDSYLNNSSNLNTLWIYQDIGQTYDFNTTKIWTSSFKGKDNIKTVKFQEITKSGKRASQAFRIEIGDSAFANCKNLAAFNVALYSDEGDDHVEYLRPENLPIGKNVFAGCENVKIYVPRDLVSAFQNDDTYGWSQYKSLIQEGDFGATDYTEEGVIYSYYTSADGQTRYKSNNNTEMEAILSPFKADFRNFSPSQVLVYNQSDKVKYMLASGVNPDKINDKKGVMKLYSDIGETYPNHYKTVAFSASGFQNQTCIKEIKFEDIVANNYNTITDFSLIIPNGTFKGCSNLKSLNMFMLNTKGTNRYVAIKPSQVFIGEHVFDGVDEDFRIRVLPALYNDYITDPNWSQYKDLIVASDYLPTDATEVTVNGVTYDYATKVMNGMTSKQVSALKTSWWTALVIGVEVAIAAATWGSGSATEAVTSESAFITFDAQAGIWENTVTGEVYLWHNPLLDVLGAAAKDMPKLGFRLWGENYISNRAYWLSAVLSSAIVSLDAAAIVGTWPTGIIHDNNTAFNYISNRVKKNYNRPSTWSMTAGGFVVNTEQITNVPHMYVKSMEDRDVAIIYNDCGDGNNDYQTVAVAYDAFHNKKKLEEVKFQERYGDGTRSIAGGLTIALPDSMFSGCTKLKTLNLVNRSTGAESANHCYKALTPDNFIPMGDIFAGMDSTVLANVKIKVGKEVLQEFLDDEYWSRYKDMFEAVDVAMVRKQLEWSCNYALAYDKNTLPLRTTSGTHNIDHVCVYAGDDDELKKNEGLAALINDFGEWNNYKLDYVKNDAFKGNKLLKTLDMTDSHTNVADVYDSSFYIALQDSAFAHCPEFENLNLIYQVTDGTNHCEQMKPEQFTLGNGVFHDTPKLKIKFCLDQEDAFLADTAWVKYKDKFAPCFFEPLDSKVGDILLHPYRFLTKLNDGTNFSYVDATRPKPEDLKTLFKGTGIQSFDEFRAFGSCGLNTVYNGMFSGCSSLQHIMLPDSTRTIETNAFQNCPLLRQLTIPEKVTSIQENAFTGSGIQEFQVKSSVPADIDAEKAFAGLANADSYIIYVTDSVVGTYKTKWAAVADHINGIGTRRGLKVVHLKQAGTLAKELGLDYTYTSSATKDNVLSGSYAQYDSLRIIGPIDGRDIGVIRYMGGRDVDDNKPTAGHLKYLDLYEADLKSAGKYDYNRAFYNDAHEGNLGAWPNNYIRNDNEVSYFMFWGLNSLETLILPKSATSIKYGAFEHCKNLRMLVIGDNMTDIAKEVNESYVAVSTPNKVVLVMLGDKVPETDEKAFYATSGTSFGTSDTWLKYPTADDSRFSLCITPYNSVRNYSSDYAYTSTCDSLMRNFEDQALVEALKKKHVFSAIDLLNTKDITGYVSGNKDIKKFDDLYMSSVTTLGDNTLTGMENLETVAIPVACKKITATAFKGCTSLKTVNAFCPEPPTLETDAFESLPEDFIIYVAEGTEDTYRKAWEQYKTHINGYRAIRNDVREITLTKPNTLGDSLGAKFTMVGTKIKSVGCNLGTLTHLKVSGPIGGKDIALIRYLGGREPDWNNPVYTTNLKYLDLYDAQLCADDFYFELRWTNRRIEKDNEVPKDMLWNCDNLETVILPRTATKLNYEACYDMASLKTLVIGDDVTYIDDDALGSNRKLENLIFLCKSKPGIHGDAFTDPLEGANRKVGKMYVRKNLVEAFSADEEYTGHTGELACGFEDDGAFRAFGSKAIATEDDLAGVNNVDGWFKNFNDIKNLSQLSKTKITSLKGNELDNLKSLNNVSFPSTLTSLDKDVFKENTSLHWVDLTACDSLKTDISTLGVCGDALVYQPASFAESNAANVVYGKSGAMQCNEYYITDAHGYDVPKAFTAKKVTFGRKFTKDAYSTVTLPFAVTDRPSGFKFYTIDADSVKNGVMFFKPNKGGITATSPYLVRAKKEQMVIDAETAVPATTYRTNTVQGNGYVLTGNLQPVSAANAKALKYMIMNDNTLLWDLATADNDSIPPYRAYAQTVSSGSATTDVQSSISDILYHYYIGTTRCDIQGDGSAEEPLTVDKLALVDGKDFKADTAFTASAATYSRTMNNTWGTLCLPYAIDASINPDYKIYEVTGITESALVIKELTGTVEAGRPVLLRSRKKGATITLNASEPTQVLNAVSTDVNGHIVGSYVETTLPNSSYFIASDKFWLTDNYQGTKIKGFRGYVVNNEQGAKASSLTITEEGDATAIDKLNAIEDDTNAIFYDANGRRTDGLQKGVNIIKRGDKVTKVVID